MKKFLIGLVLVLLLSFVSADRLYTWGKAEPITLRGNCLHSFDHMDYCFQPNGQIDIKKEGVEQGNLQFGLKGNLGLTSIYKTSADYVWTWTTISQTPGNIVVRGKALDKDFSWIVDLSLSEFGYMKTKNSFTNLSLTKNLVTPEFFYIFEMDTSKNSSAYYFDLNGLKHEFDYNTNVFNSTKNSLKMSQEKIFTNNFAFELDDANQLGFEVKNIYVGKLDQTPAATIGNTSLPVGKGYIISFEREPILFANQTITIDPTITPIAYRNRTAQMSNNDGVDYCAVGLIAGHLGSVNYYWKRLIPYFSISQKVLSATFYLDYVSKRINGETCTFDLNSVNSIASSCPTWNTAVYETIKDNWFDDTISGDINSNVTAAWNNSLNAGRNYLAFRIKMDNESSYTNTINDCEVTFLDSNIFIEYTPDPCYPTLNANWDINSQITCTNKQINIGTGQLVVNSGGSLTLIDSNVAAKQLDLNTTGDLIYLKGSSIGSFLKVTG